MTSVLYLAALVSVCRLDGGIRPTFLLGFALLFRLTAFQIEPLFSDDLYRYQWEGRVAAAGLNPYDHRPAEPALAHLLHPRVDGKDFKPVYGPLLQSLQLALVNLGGATHLPVMKIGACLADLLLCWLLWQWLPPNEKWRWIAWAWSPLGLVEFWGMGHHDSVMVALALAALYAAERHKWPWAYTLLGLAAATKYWPILLWPYLARRGNWRWAALTPLVFAICWLPWLTDISENAKYTGGFVGGWRNNDILFGPILALAGSLDAAKRASLALIALSSLAAALFAKSPRQAYWTVALTILLVSANVHPWYLTWILPLTVFHWPWPVLIWGALAPVHYVVLIRWRQEHIWEGLTNWRWAVYLPVFALLMVQIVRRRYVGNPRA